MVFLCALSGIGMKKKIIFTKHFLPTTWNKRFNMILLNTIEHFKSVKCERIKAWDFIMLKVLHAKYIILYWFFDSSHREKQASARILRKYEGYDNLWMWCDACDIWMRGGQVAQKLTFEASLAHNLILCANSAGSLCCFSSQKSGCFLVWEYLRYPPTHPQDVSFADFWTY